jgi:hypothetical protein
VPPLNEGGWYIIAGFFLPPRSLLWWAGSTGAPALGLGKHVAWAFASAIWLFLVLGLFRPLLMGSWSEAVPYGIFPHLDWTAAFSIRYGNLYYNPFHMPLDRAFLYGSCCCSPCTARRSWPSPATAATASSSRSPTAARPPNARRCSGAGPWASTPRWNRIHRWAWWFAVLTPITGGIGILLTGTVVDNWYLWGHEARHRNEAWGEKHTAPTGVTCYTCHRGQNVPQYVLGPGSGSHRCPARWPRCIPNGQNHRRAARRLCLPALGSAHKYLSGDARHRDCRATRRCPRATT